VFTDQDKDFIEVELFTTRHLGRQDTAKRFVDLLFRYDGIYLPESWDTKDRSQLRHSFDRGAELIEEWIKPEEWKTLFFARNHPKKVQILVDMQRFCRAKFNGVSLFIHQSLLQSAASERQLLNFTIEMGLLGNADYGFIAHTRQERRQSPILTPAERLPGIYWANFLGRPYIEFFGRDKLLATPCYEIREINDDLILLLTAESLNAPEMIDGDDVVNQVKAYLNQNAFAGPNFPQQSCAVPAFNFGDVRGTTEPPIEVSPDEKLARLCADLQAKGYKLLQEKNRRLIFRRNDESIVVIDKDRGEVCVDLTGQFFNNGLDDDHR